jgi:ribonuclease VapC
MIALDSSALLAIVHGEAESEAFAQLISENDCLLGAPTSFEAYIVIRARGDSGHMADLQRLCGLPNVTTIAFTSAHADAARAAFDRFGKGRRHPAQLNYGDCLAYAIARVAAAPLLFKGEDFRRTDIEPALQP